MRHRPGLALALAGLLGSAPTLAASDGPASTPDAAVFQQLLERMERLEARNAQLEREVRELRQEREAVDKSLASTRLSSNEPELTTRLKAVEQDVVALKHPAKLAEKLDGIAVDAALATVWQRASGLPHGADHGDHFNYRADLSVEVPLDALGNIEHKLFAHVRAGQGQGLNETFGYLGHFNVPNATAFAVSGADPNDSVTLLGQAWYQAAIPLPLGGFRDRSRQTLELTFGKMDIFGFFDQNEAASDEGSQFINGLFVHNPLLDVGGEVGVDANGFQPGLVASYVNENNGSEPWRLSFGVFGAGDTASNYQDTADSPLVIAQFDKTFKFFDGRTGNYRAYAWTRRDVPRFDDEVTSSRHTGFGLSVDQQVGNGLILFGRYGQLLRGKLPFDRAITLGTQINGAYWGRAADAAGIATSWLRASGSYRRAGGEAYYSAASVEAGTADVTFRPSGAERVTELYYRYQLTPQFSLSPDLQWIQRGGANADADTVTVFGLRANITY
ncbi:MAG: carbohydrate porin [Azoarcus sp.]|jgi:hypothetical protein|nr:carbohydrate porin [Azoarcus sp.]